MATEGKKEINSNLVKNGSLTLKPDDLNPFGIVVVGDKLVIADGESKKVRVYRRHDGMLLSSSDRLESWPEGVCCVNDTNLCVVMRDGIITLMSVSYSGRISRGTTFHLTPSFNYCTCVASFRDNVVVSGVKDNTIYWCVVSLQDGRHDSLHKVCGGEWSWMTTKKNMAYIACLAYNSPDDRGVYGFNLLNPSQPPYKYKSKVLSSPRGITVDDNGYLFVCDIYYKSIHHLTEKYELVAIFKEGIPRDPYAIFWDRGILYLAARKCNVISMYETPHQGHAKTHMYRRDERKKGYRLAEDVAKLTLEDKKGKQQKIDSTLFRTTPAIQATGFRSTLFGTTPATQATGFSFDSPGIGIGTSVPAKTQMYRRDVKKKGLVEDVAKLTLEDKKDKQQKIDSTLFGTTPATQATGFSSTLFGTTPATQATGFNFDSAGIGIGTSGKLHRNVLNRCLSALLEDLDFRAVSVYIQEKELFDPMTMRDILEQKTTTEKIKELIERIQLRDQDTYDKFKKCLVLAKQTFLKDMLEKEEALLLGNKRKT